MRETLHRTVGLAPPVVEFGMSAESVIVACTDVVDSVWRASSGTVAQRVGVLS